MNNVKIYIYIIVILAISCNPKNDFKKEFHSKLEEINYSISDNRLTHVVILPGAGCTTCISDIENYFISKIYDHPETLLILTSFANKKSIDINFKRELFNTPNVYIDIDGIFNSGQFLSLYPLFMRIEKGEISSFEYAKPENPNAFNNYLSQIGFKN